MSRLAVRLASTTAAVVAVGVISATPAFADPCTSGEKITGRTAEGWICTKLDDESVSRIVPFG